MASRRSNREIEVKLRIPSAAAARRLLYRYGFRVRHRRAFETNVIYDTPDHDLRRNSRLLRVRQTGPHALLTFKGVPEAGKYKSREELEVDLSDPLAFGEILRRLGLEPSHVYEKYRTEYARRGSAGVITLDETPFADFLELEGPPSWIDRTARLLGFRETDYITSNYLALFWEHCRRQGIPPGDMVFRTPLE